MFAGAVCTYPPKIIHEAIMAMRRQYQGVGSCAWLPELGRLMYRLLADRNGICAVCEVVDWERGGEGSKEECEGRNGYNECRVSAGAGAGGPGGAAMQPGFSSRTGADKAVTGATAYRAECAGLERYCVVSNSHCTGIS